MSTPNILQTIQDQQSADRRRICKEIQYAVCATTLVSEIIIPYFNLKGIKVIEATYSNDYKHPKLVIKLDTNVSLLQFQTTIRSFGWTIPNSPDIQQKQSSDIFVLEPGMGYREVDMNYVEEKTFYFITDSIDFNTALEIAIPEALNDFKSIAIGKRANWIIVYRDPQELYKRFKDHPRAQDAVVYTLNVNALQKRSDKPYWFYSPEDSTQFFTLNTVNDRFINSVISFKSFRMQYEPKGNK